MKSRPTLFFFSTLILSFSTAFGQSPQILPFSQNWTDQGLITLNDVWTGVPGVIGYRGDGLTSSTGVDPQTVIADGAGTPVDVNANQINPNTFTTGGVSEFHITDPTIALQGSGTARAPHIVIAINTLGHFNVPVSYNVRDIDGSADNAVQQVALQYRVGSSGNYTNIPAGYIADATDGGIATRVTPVNVILPPDANNQPLVQIRILTTDAVGSDEWVGIDDIVVGGGGPSFAVSGAANPSTVTEGQFTLLTATVTPTPSSTGISVNADLSSVGGLLSQSLFDDGTNGDVTAGDNVFSWSAWVATGTSPGVKSLPISVSDAQGNNASTFIELTVDAPSASGPIVISQVYGGGGNSGALYRNDFIELFNRGTTPVSLSGWSVQYTSSAGSSWQVTPLSGLIQPGRYFLVQQAAGAGGTLNLPAPDGTGAIAMAAGSGKVALVHSVLPLVGSCPTGSMIIDFVGYGSANCFEGTGAAATLSNTTAALRRQGGCVDSENNASDFFAGSPTPSNGLSPFNDCSAPPPDPIAIHVIQGSGSSSPYVGQTVVTTPSVVTGFKTNGFFVQTPDNMVDGDPATSEGVFVFTGSGNPLLSSLNRGDLVSVTGQVAEFVPSADPLSPPLTEIAGGVFATVLTTGNALPQPIDITALEASPFGTIEQLERFEGMRVSVQSLTVSGPTQGSISEPNATSTSNGVFYGVVSGLDRPFREPGIEIPFPLPSGAPSAPVFDANPERIRVDSDGQPGAGILNVSAGEVVTGLIGPLDYSFRTYTILPDPSVSPSVTGSIEAVPVADPSSDELTVATFNMQRLFDTVNDPAVGEPVVTPSAFAARLNKLSLSIRTMLKTPDIIGAVEVENLPTLQALANVLNADAMSAGMPDRGYTAFLVEGNDVGGIDVGFLVKSTKVTVTSVTQEGKTSTYVNPNDGSSELLNDRPPLILKAEIQRPHTAPYAVTAIVVHQRSLNGVDDPIDGPRVRAKRKAQAEFLASLIQARQSADPSERILVLGDFNAFGFNDGYVDVMGTVMGIPAPAGSVASPSPDLVNPDLADLSHQVPAAQRYSYVFDGNAQELDHILANQAALPDVRRVEFARINADFAEVYRNDVTRPERISDHDPMLVALALPPSNNAPVADAGEDQTVECAGHSGTAVTLDGSGSTEADGDSLTHSWSYNGSPISTEAVVTVTLELGSHSFVLVVDDLAGGTDADTVLVHVVDTTPPFIDVSVTPSVLWPPTGKFVTVQAEVLVSDSCDESPVVTLISITKNDPAKGGIEGAAIGTSDSEFRLLAERGGKNKSGLVYTIVYGAVDASGNIMRDSAIVTVPHDMSAHAGAFGEMELIGEIPTEFSVGQNYPNPFNPSTIFRFGLPSPAFVSLKIYSMTGEEVAILVHGLLAAGYHTIEWNAGSLPTGVYVYRMIAGEFNETRKLLLVK